MYVNPGKKLSLAGFLLNMISLPLLEGIVACLHVLGFFSFVIVLWCVLSATAYR